MRAAKRAGRVYDESGMDGTSPGECVIECPLCPYKGRNLPPDFADLPKDQRWAYFTYVFVGDLQ